jgi:methionyl-tRNA formyltransferase
VLDIFNYKFNIHGSLLPKYRGRTPHIWAIINNEKYTGITIHDMALECDAGDILFQKRIPIKYTDTGEMVLEKYFYHYPRMIKYFLRLFDEEKIVPQKQNEKLKTYFDKRTPENGRITWDWQRERIYNWVRALAPPYPGAFCYFQGTKITINKIEFSDFGFSCDIKNGTILDIDDTQITVKVQNGCIKIIDFTMDINSSLKREAVLS